MKAILNKFNMNLSWEDKDVKVYNNDVLCLKHEIEENSHMIKITYLDVFEKWGNALYQHEFGSLDRKNVEVIEQVISTLLENKNKAIIEYTNEEGFRDYKLEIGALKESR